MLNSLFRLYVADLAAAAFLLALRVVDVKMLHGAFFYPRSQVNGWTILLLATLVVAALPYILMGFIWVLRETVGIPSEMKAVPVRVRAK